MSPDAKITQPSCFQRSRCATRYYQKCIWVRFTMPHAIWGYHAVFCGKRGGQQRQVHDDLRICVGVIPGTFSSHQRQFRCSPYVIESIHGAKHSPPARRGAPDCPSAQMQTSDFQVVSGHFGLEFESHMMSHGMKSNTCPMQWYLKKVLGVLGFIMVMPEHV